MDNGRGNNEDGTTQEPGPTVILLKDKQGEEVISYGGSVHRRVIKDVQRGSLLAMIPSEKQTPRSDGKAIHNCQTLYIDRNITLSCDGDNVDELSYYEHRLLAGVQSAEARYQTYIAPKKLDWGKHLKVGDRVLVSIPDSLAAENRATRKASAVIQYVGSVEDQSGVTFGVEILDPQYYGQGTTDGTFWNERYFTCPDGNGLLVSLEELSEESTNEAFTEPHVQNYAPCAPRTDQKNGQRKSEPPPMAEPSTDSPPRFKVGDRVVIFKKKGDVIHGTVRWSGKYQDKKKKNSFAAVGIETDVMVHYPELESYLPPKGYAFTLGKGKGRVFVREEQAMLEKDYSIPKTPLRQTQQPKTGKAAHEMEERKREAEREEMRRKVAEIREGWRSREAEEEERRRGAEIEETRRKEAAFVLPPPLFNLCLPPPPGIEGKRRSREVKVEEMTNLRQNIRVERELRQVKQLRDQLAVKQRQLEKQLLVVQQLQREKQKLEQFQVEQQQQKEELLRENQHYIQQLEQQRMHEVEHLQHLLQQEQERSRRLEWQRRQEVGHLQQQLQQEQERNRQLERQRVQQVGHLQQQLQQEQERSRQLQERLDASAAEMEKMRPTTQLLRTVEFNTVNRTEVHIQTTIGKGAWGDVARGKVRGQPVAVKRPHLDLLQQYPNIVDRMRREVRIMAQVRHPNLVRFIAAVLDKAAERLQAAPMIITELLDTNLRLAYQQGRLQDTDRVTILRDVAYALHYLHEHTQPIIHRDISAPNVLLQALPNRGWLAKVSDFGSANLAKLARTAGEGAIIYTAPEAFPHTDPRTEPPPLTTKIDVYSYGILVCEVLTSQPPFPENYRGMQQQVKGKWEFMYNLTVRCTNHNPLNRPTMAQVLDDLNTLPRPPPRPLPRPLP